MRDRWQKVEELFRAALDMEPSQRAAFLSQACASDPELRAEVELLINAGSNPDIAVSSREPAKTRRPGEGLPEAGSAISHYKVGERLGKGGMSEVYLADDLTLDRKVAIKLLPQDNIPDESSKRRLVREAKAAARLDHPNICAIYEVGEQQDYSFIAMQYVEGETLADRIKPKPLDVKQSLEIAIQIADALAEAHSHGIVHRDVKPQNIMITPRGQVKVLDFGLAKLTVEFCGGETDTEILLTQPGAIVGTVPYMSPEQVRSQPIDSRSDIFSFGSTLYEMLTGRHPFEAESSAATLSGILTQEQAPLGRFAASVPAELERIVRKCLEKEKDRRYQSARELVIDLQNLQRDLFYSSSSATRPASAYIPGGKRVAFTKKTAATILVSVLILAALAAYLIFRRAKEAGTIISSIAVLPFNNFTSEPDSEYLSDGITDSLINSLSQIPGLKVMSRNAVFRYRGQDIDVRELGRTLQVKAILTGGFVRRGEQLSISAELVDTSDASHIWGQQYNRLSSDIMSVQEDISREITSNLRLKLTGDDERRLVKRNTSNTAAYQVYLKGRYYTDKLTEEGITKGINYFKQAISLDPDYAQAHNGLANSYILMSDWLLPPREAIPKAKEEVIRALALDEELADAHATLGIISHTYDWDWSKAEDELKRAIQLNPNGFNAHEAYYSYLISAGRFDQALVEARRALEIDPVSVGTHTGLAGIYYYSGQYSRAIEQLNKTLQMDQSFWLAHLYLGRSYERVGKREELINELRKARQLEQTITDPLAALGRAYGVVGNRAEALKVIRELEERAQHDYVPPYNIAIVYLGIGDKDRAFEWLERSHRDRNYYLARLMVDPELDPVRSDPRFMSLAKRLGLVK
jgi:eukaryotic-like serine/threonine-protein kinase